MTDVEKMTPQRTTGCSKRPFSAAAASDEARRYPLRYVEPLSDARTKLEAFFNILLENSTFIGIVVESVREVTVTAFAQTILCNLLSAFPDLGIQEAWSLRLDVGSRYAFGDPATISAIDALRQGAVW
jgi:hypothetical protein